MTEMKKHIYDETNGLWYELIGDYYIPVFTLSSEEQRPIGNGDGCTGATSKSIARFSLMTLFSAIGSGHILLI